jgi:pectin methylesterase-like acyl-CoA thioesterase
MMTPAPMKYMDDTLLCEFMPSPFRGIVRIAVLALALSALYAVIPLQTELWWLGLLLGLIALLAITPFTVRRATAIATSERPMLAAAEAIVWVVAMLVFGFSSVYLAINRGEGEFVGLSTKVDAVYFTATTLATVGFGDIHAAGQAARVAVTMQMVLDLSLLAIAVRLLVRAAKGSTLQ